MTKMHSKKNKDKMAKVNDKGIKKRQKEANKSFENVDLEMFRNVLRLTCL